MRRRTTTWEAFCGRCPSDPLRRSPTFRRTCACSRTSEAGVSASMKKAVAGAEREQLEGASGKWVAHWKMVHIVRPVWEKVGQANQLGRAFPALTYTPEDAAGLTLLEPAPRTI